MNNPFINLRKFVRDRADPKENHATESLAACLQFSPVLRKEFVRFLFGDTPLPFNNDDCTALEVSSQENVGKFGILDLYLSLPERIHIIVEVKVEAPEDEEQLRDYSNWLKTQGGDHKFLFSLVGFPNRKFRYSEFGVLHPSMKTSLNVLASSKSNDAAIPLVISLFAKDATPHHFKFTITKDGLSR